MEKYTIYTGAYGAVASVLRTGEGNWVDAVKDMGLKTDAYYRCMELEDGTHIDFGSWSVFVRLDKE